MSQDRGRGILFVLSAPSGTGKTTIAEYIIANVPGITRSISHTTRRIRAGEMNGRDYIFIDKSKFDAMVKTGEFVEHAKVHENNYGTAASSIYVSPGTGSDKSDILLVIDIQGAAKIREKGLNAVLIFLLPPSMKELKRRMGKRGSEKQGEIEIRLKTAKKEMGACSLYDYIVVNDELETACREVENIIRAERSKKARQSLRFPDYETPPLS
jgi:guanylate kinase